MRTTQNSARCMWRPPRPFLTAMKTACEGFLMFSPSSSDWSSPALRPYLRLARHLLPLTVLANVPRCFVLLVSWRSPSFPRAPGTCGGVCPPPSGSCCPIAPPLPLRRPTPGERCSSLFFPSMRSMAFSEDSAHGRTDHKFLHRRSHPRNGPASEPVVHLVVRGL